MPPVPTISHLTIKNNNIENTRGRGFWKLNTSLLEDMSYIKLIKNAINNVKTEYKECNDKQLIWELIKLEVRNRTIHYCIKRKMEQK